MAEKPEESSGAGIDRLLNEAGGAVRSIGANNVRAVDGNPQTR